MHERASEMETELDLGIGLCPASQSFGLLVDDRGIPDRALCVDSHRGLVDRFNTLECAAQIFRHGPLAQHIYPPLFRALGTIRKLTGIAEQ